MAGTLGGLGYIVKSEEDLMSGLPAVALAAGMEIKEFTRLVAGIKTKFWFHPSDVK